MSPPERRSGPVATSNRPAEIVDTTPTTPRVRRPADNAGDGALFEVISNGGTRIVMLDPAEDARGVKDLTPRADPVAVAHKRMADTDGAASWLRLAEWWIDDRLDRGLTVDTDRMQTAIGPPPNAGLPAVAIRQAKLTGKIKMVGFLTSQRPEARGHAIREWGPR